MINISVKNVSKKFKEIEVLSNVTCSFESGHIYGLYGRNGSGKSVLLKLLCGFYVPTSGEILYNGEVLDIRKKFPQDLRALIENPSFFPDETGFENLNILAKIQNKIGSKEILVALDIVNLLPEKDKKYRAYSLGMKQKLGIAQVIMENPQIMIFDEPFNGIERETVAKIIQYLKIEASKGKCILVSSHIMEDLQFLTSEIYYFDAGKIYERQAYEKTL